MKISKIFFFLFGFILAWLMFGVTPFYFITGISPLSLISEITGPRLSGPKIVNPLAEIPGRFLITKKISNSHLDCSDSLESFKEKLSIEFKSKIFRTDQQGTIVLKCDKMDKCEINKSKN